jgi:hypothetical protein
MTDQQHKQGLLNCVRNLEQNQRDLAKEGEEANPDAYARVAEFIEADRHLDTQNWASLTAAEREALDIAIEEFQESPELFTED